MKPYRNKASAKNTVPKARLVQKEPVEVFCRIRPLANPNDVACLRARGEHGLQLLPPEIFQKNKDCVVSEYTFRYVFSETSTQDKIFSTVALPLVTDLLNGKNGLLFTYGVTSSGKTYTMTGTPDECGILPRCLDVIFNSIKFQQTSKFVFKPNKQNGFEIQSTPDALLEQQKELCRAPQKTPKLRRRNQIEWNQRMIDTNLVEMEQSGYVYTIFVSFVEIYNNYIYDLLDDGLFDAAKGRPPQSRTLREDMNRNMYVSDTTELEVKSADEAFDVFWRGQQKRKVAHTALNTESSRSHSVFVIRVVQAVWNSHDDDVDVSILPTVSQLSLVDLAGSERTVRTRNVGSRLKEAGSINNSLMVLRQCIEVLRDKQLNPVASASKMVPYRDNKLTLLFKSFFEGEGRVKMIVCANPAINEYDETVQAMKFAEMAQDVLIPRQVQRPPPPPVPPKMARMDSAMPLTLGPGFPDLILNCPDDSITIKTLEHYMVARLNYRTEALEKFAERQAEFREHLVQTESENNIMRQQLRTMQMDLNHRMEQLGTVERRCAKAEQSTEGLQRKLNDLEREKRNLQGQLRDRERRINATKVNQLKLETEMKDQLQLERDRMNRMMERRLAAKEAELQAKMCLSEERMRMLRDILNSGDDWAWNEDQVVHNIASSTSDPQLHRKVAPPHTPRSASTRDSRSDPKLAGTRTPGRVGVPAANPRHRRSASAGCDKWIEHRPLGSVETGTIFQPMMKKKKSVSKLESKDIVEASKYVLTHQEAKEGTGEVKTQLYKGNVVPSCGGGAQVIFDDVEVLKQTSPPHGYMLRKRSAEQLLPGSQEENRCRPAIENKAPAQFKKARV